eukprot:1961436-Ditylum_brightwellii.AAC.1
MKETHGTINTDPSKYSNLVQSTALIAPTVLVLEPLIEKGCIKHGGTTGIRKTIGNIKTGISKTSSAKMLLHKTSPAYYSLIIDKLDQPPIFCEIDALPTDKEIQTAIRQINNKMSGKSGIKVEIYKALVTD